MCLRRIRQLDLVCFFCIMSASQVEMFSQVEIDMHVLETAAEKVEKVEQKVEKIDQKLEKVAVEAKQKIENLLKNKERVEQTDARLSQTCDFLSTKQTSMEMRLMYVDLEVAEAIRQITHCLETFDHNCSSPDLISISSSSSISISISSISISSISISSSSISITISINISISM